MTAIATIIDEKNKKTYLASDSMGSNKFTGKNYKTKKIFKNKHISFAYCGSYRIGQVLNHNLNPRPFQVGEDVEDYVFDYLEEEIRRCLSQRKCLKEENSVQKINNAEILIAVSDRIFTLQSDLAFLEPDRIYSTSGSGEFHVEASIHTQLQMNPKKDLKQVLTDAINYTAEIVLSVGGDVHILEHEH